MQKYLNRFDLHIVKTYKLFEIDHFNQRQILRRAAKFAKRAGPEYVEFNRVTPFDGMEEWWNGGIFYIGIYGIALL